MGSAAKGIIERPRTTCAQGGALATLASLPDVIGISHAAEGCSGNLTGSIGTCSGYNGEGYCGGTQTPSSAVREKNVVFGGTDRLRQELKSAQELLEAKLFVVVTGCMTEIIGDDVQAVVDEFEDAQTPVIAVNTPSFEGDAYSGYERVLTGIFNKYIPESEKKDEKLVNIFGLIPNFDPNYRGDLEEIKRILESVGLKVNTFFTPDQTYENILDASKASLNIHFSRIWGVDFEKGFEQKHGTPFWVTDLPIGSVQTTAFLRELSEHIEIDKDLLEKVIEREEERYYNYFIKTLDLVINAQFFYYAATVSNSNYAIPLSKFLKNELGWKVDDVFVTDLLTKIKAKKLEEAFNQTEAPGELIRETDTKQIAWQLNKRHARNQGQRYFDQHGPLFIVGSSLEKYAAQDIGALTFAVSYPIVNRVITQRGYSGYNGGLNLLADLISVPVSGR
jgi:nitrogenase molybdenum-iron protein beta chain